MVMSGMPATATMSPGPACSPGLRSSPSVTRSSVTRTFLTSPSRRIHATFWPLRRVPWWIAEQRQPAEERRRVEVGDVRLQRRALDVRRRRDGLEDGAEQRLEVGAVGHRAVGRLLEAGDAGLAAGVDDREVERVLAVAVVEQVHEQLVGLVDDLGDPGVAAVDLVDHEHDRHVGVERLAQHEPGLRQRALARVDQQHDAVDHRQAALDLAAEVGVAGGVDDVDRHALGRGRAGVVDRGVLGEDRDPLLALEVTGVHDPLADALGLVRGEGAGLAQHGVDQRGLAVVDVRDDRDVAQVRLTALIGLGHEGQLYGRSARADDSSARSSGGPRSARAHRIGRRVPWRHAPDRDEHSGRARRAARLRPHPPPPRAGHHPPRREAAALAGDRRRRRRRPDRGLDLPRPRQGHQPAPRPAGQRARPLRGVERRVGAGRRHRRGARHARPGGRGRAGRVLPLHLRASTPTGTTTARRCARQGKSLLRITPERWGPVATGGFPADRVPS